ncbi:MAG: hypothetical protein ACE5HE_06075 [Phycisphaerae bacterium]
MQNRFRRLVRWVYLIGGGTCVFQAAGCIVDPDVQLRAALSAASDISIFLLENLVASL